MKQVHLAELEEQQAFVREAGSYFAANPSKHTYTQGDIVIGCWFGMRWGMGEDCVLAFRVSDEVEPTIFVNAIRDHKQ